MHNVTELLVDRVDPARAVMPQSNDFRAYVDFRVNNSYFFV